MASVIAVATGVGDVQAFTGSTELHGFSIRESAGTAAVATVIIRDGTSAAGTAIAYIELAANGSLTEKLPATVDISAGIFVDRVAGETELTLFVS